MSRKIANVMSLDLLSLALDISFSRCNIGVWLSNFVESHTGVYKECLVIREHVLDGHLQASLEFLKRLVIYLWVCNC